MLSVVVFVDHDIIVRHFIENGILPALQASYNVTFVFPRAHKRVTVDIMTLGLKNVRTIEIDLQRAYLWRRLYQHTVLRFARYGENRTFLMQFWREALGRNAFWRTWLFSRPGLYWLYKRRTMKAIGENPQLNALLEELQPDIILHPTVLEGLFVSDLIGCGQRHGVPTVYLMNSWDNPSTKAMTIGKPDRLVVWGEQTKRHSVELLGMQPDHVLCFGAAQFDVYASPPEQSPAEFKRALGVPPEVPLVVYAGSSKGIREVQHLIEIEKGLDEGRLPNCRILFRPHPWRGVIQGELDFDSVPWKYTILDPAMADYYRRSRTDASAVYRADIKHTHTVLTAAAVVVSPISTILLEAVMHGKPIVAYLPADEIDKNFFLRTMANMKFMMDFFSSFDCGPYRTLNDVIGAINVRLQITEESLQNIREKATFFVADRPQGYVAQLEELINTMAAQKEGHIGK